MTYSLMLSSIIQNHMNCGSCTSTIAGDCMIVLLLMKERCPACAAMHLLRMGMQCMPVLPSWICFCRCCIVSAFLEILRRQCGESRGLYFLIEIPMSLILFCFLIFFNA
uniref:Uncharacterized protein n=1 Tax=Opuntia streptacantha TaxID=393608 RepID=A0A7C8ZYS7_OPUST